MPWLPSVDDMQKREAQRRVRAARRACYAPGERGWLSICCPFLLWEHSRDLETGRRTQRGGCTEPPDPCHPNTGSSRMAENSPNSPDGASDHMEETPAGPGWSCWEVLMLPNEQSWQIRPCSTQQRMVPQAPWAPLPLSIHKLPLLISPLIYDLCENPKSQCKIKRGENKVPKNISQDWRSRTLLSPYSLGIGNMRREGPH